MLHSSCSRSWVRREVSRGRPRGALAAATSSSVPVASDDMIETLNVVSLRTKASGDKAFILYSGRDTWG